MAIKSRINSQTIKYTIRVRVYNEKRDPKPNPKRWLEPLIRL